MSAKLKEVRTRIQSVNNTQQITKAMKVVSAAKLRKAQEAILQMRPYAVKMTEILSNLTEATQGDVNIELARERPIHKILIVVVTSDRGLCGAFNSSVVKRVRAHINGYYAEQAARGDVRLMTIGKRGYDAFKKEPWPVDGTYVGLFGDLHFEKSAEASEYLKKAFMDHEIDRVDVVFNSFKNAATQILIDDQFLPIRKFEKAETEEEEETGFKANFIFEPDMETMVEELVPRILNTQFYRYLLDSHASEHGARMTAMDQATDNADAILKDLRISYNRARQAAITTELTEIVSGAAALAGE